MAFWWNMNHFKEISGGIEASSVLPTSCFRFVPFSGETNQSATTGEIHAPAVRFNYQLLSNPLKKFSHFPILLFFFVQLFNNLMIVYNQLNLILISFNELNDLFRNLAAPHYKISLKRRLLRKQLITSSWFGLISLTFVHC